MRFHPYPQWTRIAVFVVLGFVLVGSFASCSAALSPEEQALVGRVEAVEDLVGRHGYTDDVRFMEMLRQEAVALDLPVAEARVRLIMGRRVASSTAQAHLELAAEGFREHDEPAWEARARLALGRLLFSRFLRDSTFLSDHRDRAVAELQDAARLAQRAEDPLTAGEAHWQLGTIHRLEEEPGRAIRGFERAEEAFREADEPLLVLVARTETARIHRSMDDLDEAQAILRLALADLSDAADVDELVRLRARHQEMTSPASATDGFRGVAEGLRERGHPQMAAHMDRLADFFAERGEKLEREGWSQADLEAMGKIQMRAPRPETEPLFPVERTRLGGAIVPPLDEFMARYPDREVARRVLALQLRGELDEIDRTLRRWRLERELTSPEPTSEERFFEGLLAEAKVSGTMPDLPVEWFIGQLREAPAKYRDQQALPDWVELRAGDLYHRLGRRLGDSFRGLPEETTGSLYYPSHAWQDRYCERLKTALERIGHEEQFRCDARNGFQTLAGRFQGAAALDDRYVSDGSRWDVLEDRKRRLERLLEDPTRLSEELDDGVLEPFLNDIFFTERNPSLSVPVMVTPLDLALAVREVTEGIHRKAEAGDLEESIGRVSCALAQEQRLLRRLAVMAERSGYEQPAAAHRAREESLKAELRRKTRPSGYSKLGDAEELEAQWGVGCPASATPSFLDLKDLEPPSEGRARPTWKMRVERATESLDSGEYREAARVLRTVADAGIDRPETRATVLHGLGRAYAGLGEPERALAAFRRAAAAWEEVVGGFDRPAELASYFGGAAETYDRLIELSIDAGRPEEAFGHAERARARAFLRRLGTAPIAASGFDGVPEPLVEDMNRLRARLVRLENLRDAPDMRQAADGAMTEGEIERRLETVRKSLLQVVRRVDAARGGGGESFTDLATASPAEIRAALPPDTVLVEYHLLPERGFAWVVDRDGLEVVELPAGADWLRGDVEDLRTRLADRQEYRDLAGDLYDTLVAPIRPHLRGRTAVLVPHGPLHALPFGALWNRRAERHLIEELSWTTLPSASALRGGRAARRETGGRALVVGDPEVSTAARLLGARDSARAVAGVLDAEPLLGGEATESAVRSRLPKVDILHFGTHAFLSETDAALHWIALTPGPDAPWAADDDGRLELHEIRRLDLRHLDLVTLAACETAVGETTAGDDVTALQRAFLESGARRVVATLWPVSDEAAAAWSETFYQGLREGDPVIRAAHRAQRKLLEGGEWSHPYDWAGFVLSGPPTGAE